MERALVGEKFEKFGVTPPVELTTGFPSTKGTPTCIPNDLINRGGVPNSFELEGEFFQALFEELERARYKRLLAELLNKYSCRLRHCRCKHLGKTSSELIERNYLEK